MAFEYADDLFGHRHFLFLDDDAAFNDVDCDIRIDQCHGVKAERVGVAFHFQDVLAAKFVAARVFDDRDLVVLSVQVKVVIDQHGFACLYVVKNDSVFYFAYV